MILKHYTIKCENKIEELKKELDKLDDGFTNLHINTAYVNQNDKLILELDEKKIDEILELKDK